MLCAAAQRVAIVSDAWHPQVNGVVRTLAALEAELARMGITAEVFGPDRFLTLPCPTYHEIRLAVLPARRLRRLLTAFAPHRLHITTEGPLGRAARAWALAGGRRFTTSLHTRFPDYVSARTGLPAAPFWSMLRRFHRPAAATMVATETLQRELAGRGFPHLCQWSRGVDTALFRPGAAEVLGLPRPVFLHAGRVAPEKNLPAFLSLDLPGSKVVIGDGPALPELRRQYPAAHFLGARSGPALARAYAAADVLVFPSRTDTFGLVMLEALACGTPVAAFPVPGPLDVLDATTGVMHADLRAAALAALHLDRATCVAAVGRRSWRASAEQFAANLVPLQGTVGD